MIPIFKFWTFFVVTPLIIDIVLGFFNFSTLATLIADYIVFISPFIFFIFPYGDVREKIIRTRML